MSFHLQFTASPEFFTFEELGCLARAAGFNSELFEKCLPKQREQLGAGITLFDLDLLLESRQLDKDLHRTMNWRTGVANAAVVRTAAQLIASRKLSFKDVYDARVAFDLYDHEQDHEGIFLKDLHGVSRALKLCHRAMGPAQLRSELRRVTGALIMPSRIQLHEFLQLLLCCSPLISPTVRQVGSLDKDQRDLYRLADFKKLLTPEDEQRQQSLDAQRHWKMARIKLHINNTLVKDVNERRSKVHARIQQAQPAAPVTEHLSWRMTESNRLLRGARQGKALPADVALEISGSEIGLLSRESRAPARESAIAAVAAAANAATRPYSAPVGRVSQRAQSAAVTFASNSSANDSQAKSSQEGRARSKLVRPHTAADGRPTGRAIDSQFVREALAELSMSESDLHLRTSKEPPIIKDDAKLEHSALMQDLKWDLATGEDPALRKLLRDSWRAPLHRVLGAAANNGPGAVDGANKATVGSDTTQGDRPPQAITGRGQASRIASAPPGGGGRGQRRRSSVLVREATALLQRRHQAWAEDTRAEAGDSSDDEEQVHDSVRGAHKADTDSSSDSGTESDDEQEFARTGVGSRSIKAAPATMLLATPG